MSEIEHDRAARSRGSGSVETLLEALPYIREFHGRTVVIKYGGAAMRDEALREDFATDVVLLKYVGLNPVDRPRRRARDHRVHGAARARGRASTRACASPTRRRSRWRRWSCVGKLNSDIVQRLNRHGQPAVGLSGEDGTLFEVAPVANAEQVGFVGSIERVDVDVLNHIAADYIPVIASSASDRDGQSYNVNADEAAGKVAAALGAYKAIFLTDVEGWLADPDDEASLISRATVGEVEEQLRGDRRRDAAEAAACVDAIRGGAQSAHIIDGRKPAQPPARALHRRRHRHDGDAVRA